jgi:hypothetical protein
VNEEIRSRIRFQRQIEICIYKERGVLRHDHEQCVVSSLRLAPVNTTSLS